MEPASGRDVLEIGVGLGSDHQRYAEAGARLTGVDSRNARSSTRVNGWRPCTWLRAAVADAENLPFGDASFDMVYSWGVLHHSPNTRKAIEEVWRVLRREELHAS